MTTEDQVEEIATKAATKAVKDTLLLMGVDTADGQSFLNMQSDFKYLREARLGKEQFLNKSKWAVLGVFIAGALGLLVKGFLAWIHAGGVGN